MLNQKDAIATVAVKSIEAARKFYEGKLGFTVADTEGDSVVTYRSGNTSLLVYESQYAGTNQATAVTWNVGGDVEAIVARLKEQGIAFEHYDLPGMKREGDVHVGEGIKVAWFKDPDGNILSMVSA